jgi:hypothetical protein
VEVNTTAETMSADAPGGGFVHVGDIPVETGPKVGSDLDDFE